MRAHAAHRVTIALQNGHADLDRREVVRGGVRRTLRAKEVELLRYLATHAGRTLPREELFAEVWGYHPVSRSRTLDTTVRRLRAVIEDDPAHPCHLLTEVGVGYRFVEVQSTPWTSRRILYGPPGVGKRTRAIALAGTFPGRVVHASGAEALETGALALGVDPAGPETRFRRRVEAARAAEPVLVVLDDVPLEEVLRWEPPLLARQVPRPPPDPRYEVLAVDPLPRDAARELLLRGAAVASDDVERLLDLLGGLPQAIALAASRLPFCGPGVLADALVADPGDLYRGADAVARAALLARSMLDAADREGLDAISFYAGPVPTAVMTAAAGGLGVLGRLRDRGWLAPRADGGWIVPSAWNQVAMLWRELGEIDRVADAVSAGLELLEGATGAAAMRGGLHSTMGTALVDAGRPEEALHELRIAGPIFTELGLAQRARYVDLVARIARELRGEDTAAEWQADDRGGDDRLDHLVAALAGRSTPEAAQFADRTADPALRGVLCALAGEALPEGVRSCSYEARMAERLFRARAERCHTSSHGRTGAPR